MDTRHRNPSGAPVEQCSDDESCRVITCEACLKESPADSVRHADAQDYVHHFCGLDCLEIWRKQGAIRH
jgi:hypothetical protein